MKKKLPVLLVEDCPVIGDMVQKNVNLLIPSVECLIATSREDAISVLRTREDIKIAFLDYNLENGTNSEGLAGLIFMTQSGIVDIIATSGCAKTRKLQISRDGATKECEKHNIPRELAKFADNHC